MKENKQLTDIHHLVDELQNIKLSVVDISNEKDSGYNLKSILEMVEPDQKELVDNVKVAYENLNNALYELLRNTVAKEI